MNKNNINFQVHRTKEGTIFEIVSALLVLMSLALSVILFFKVREAGSAMLIHTGIISFCVLLMLVLAYQPSTFNIPDNSPASLFIATVRFLRITAVLLGLMALGVTVSAYLSFSPQLVFGVFGFLFVPALCWYLAVYMKAKRKKQS
ncbi:MAG: hypothetical protein IJ527_02865 [Prevotella sp.]|nr:hypothetical protein [Prevotella sp.]